MDSSTLSKILFIDIETVPFKADFAELTAELQTLWSEKYKILKLRQPEKFPETDDAALAFANNAGIYAEFGKIVCISLGFINNNADTQTFRVKSFANHDEKQLLTDFSALCKQFFKSKEHTFCGHNIKEFDIPYICRRMLINEIPLPKILDIQGKKPWDINFFDTLEMWKFGDYKNYTSLKLLSAIFGIHTPKDDIDGSQVASVYYGENDLPRIATYCQKDVVATAQIFLKMNGLQAFNQENVIVNK
ncbi:MAG: 3'-5' exonuclease [Paludibacter sp.]|jgi:DNA polymerase elongation subunit (family B)|nr:3'-5' exonuclease [Paludibacter sp.]